MSRKNRQKKQNGRNKSEIRRKVSAIVATGFPGCIAEFSGGVERSRMANRGPTFGFRVKHAQTGKYRSNIIWLNPEYDGDFSATWIRSKVKSSNN